jgi:hypothetical protein
MSSNQEISFQLKENKIIEDLHKNRKENLLTTLKILKKSLETFETSKNLFINTLINQLTMI